MPAPLALLTAATGVAFIGYGLHCLASRHMRAEFVRYGMPRLRVPVGLAEVAGGVGLLVGPWWPPVLAASAAGLCVLMAGGVVVRARVGDGPRFMLPAGALLLVNGWILRAALART